MRTSKVIDDSPKQQICSRTGAEEPIKQQKWVWRKGTYLLAMV